MVVVALVDPYLLGHHLDLGVVAVGDVDGGLDSAEGDSAESRPPSTSPTATTPRSR